MALSFTREGPSWPRGPLDFVSQFAFWACFFSFINDAVAIEHGFGDVMAFQGGTTKAFYTHSEFRAWPLPFIITCLLLISVYAYKQSMQGHRINLEPEPFDEQHQTRLKGTAERRPTAYAALHCIVSMTSLALIDPRLSSGARLTLLIGGPAVIIGLSPRLPLPLSHRWWLLFLVSGSLMVYGMLWWTMRTLFGFRDQYTQALLSWTCTGFVWLSSTLVTFNQGRAERLDHYICQGPPDAQQRALTIANYSGLIQQQDAIMADIQEQQIRAQTNHARLGVREPPRAYRPASSGNGSRSHQSNSRRLTHREAAKNMMDDFFLRGARFAAGRRQTHDRTGSRSTVSDLHHEERLLTTK